MLFKDIDNIDTNVVSILSQSGITDMKYEKNRK